MIEDMVDLESLSPDALRARGSMKWNRFGPDVLPMWVAEMDYPMAPPVLEAVRRTVERDGYGYAQVDQRVPEAFAAFAARRLGMEVNPEWTTVVPHVLSGIEWALDALTPAGAGVVVTTPAYMHFLEIPGMIGRPVVDVPLLEDREATDVNRRWTLDLDGIERAFAGGARSLILCQPYNPVGKVFSRDELAELSRIVERHGGWVLSDEIHAPLTLPGIQHVAYSSVSEAAAAHCITVTSASKSFSMPGLPCATVTLHSQAGHDLFRRNVHEDHLYGATTLGVEVNVAAYTQGDEWLEQVREHIAGNTARLKAFVETLPGVEYTPAEATYLAWIDFREAGIPGDPADFLRVRGKLTLNSGPAFGPVGAGFARMNLATTHELLEDGFQRIRTALATL